MSKFLIAYFSVTGTTKKLAKNIEEKYGFDIHEIKPIVSYNKDDLNWMDPSSRTSREEKRSEFYPEISKELVDMEKYDKIILCFPIWWYKAPRIINSFLKNYDFANKEITLFATSGGSGFGQTVSNLKVDVDSSCIFIEGKVNPNIEEINIIF